jgi:hypothetical protein
MPESDLFRLFIPCAAQRPFLFPAYIPERRFAGVHGPGFGKAFTACLNIEQTFVDLTGWYRPFPGLRSASVRA